MKKMEELKNKFIAFLKEIKKELKDRRTILIFICVVIIMYIPVWGGYLLYWIFKWKWCIGMATMYAIFWAGPFTPFFPLCIAITFFIKKFWEGKK